MRSRGQDCDFSVCRRTWRKSFALHANVHCCVTVQSCTYNLQLWMLVLHGSLHISVAHGFHDSSQVPISHEDTRAVVVPGTIQNQIVGETGLPASLAKQVAD